MAVHKRTYKSGKDSWYYVFDAPGSTRENRSQITESGFATKAEAVKAEAVRRTDVEKEYEASRKGISRPVPRTLHELLATFITEHCERSLAAKTVERYREMAGYLAPELLAMRVDDITPLHLHREWNRLLDSGGHHRRTKAARGLSTKTVRNIAGVVSSAFVRAIFWGLASTNPVTNSERPKWRRKEGVAFTPLQQRLMIDASTHWLLPAFLEVEAGLGTRRGEGLALRWSDIVGGEVRICRSLSQTKAGLVFKETKTAASTRPIEIPESVMAVLARLRKEQQVFRDQFGADYRTDMDLVFCNPDGTPLRPDSISSAVSALCRRLKLPKGASLHSLRHTHGSHLLADGVPLPDVSKRLGHSNVHVTATIYAHSLPGRDKEAARRWDAFQKRELGPSEPADRKAN